MTEIKNRAPEIREDKQGNIDNNCFQDINTFPEIPNTLPGCYQSYGHPGEYRGVDGCAACLYRLPCARAIAGGNDE